MNSSLISELKILENISIDLGLNQSIYYHSKKGFEDNLQNKFIEDSFGRNRNINMRMICIGRDILLPSKRTHLVSVEVDSFLGFLQIHFTGLRFHKFSYKVIQHLLNDIQKFRKDSFFI